jgi:hypothetical protein
VQVFNGFMQNGIVGRTVFISGRPLPVPYGGSMAWLCCRNSLTRILEAVDDLFHLKGALKVGTGRLFDFEEIQGGASCERRTARWFSRRF